MEEIENKGLILKCATCKKILDTPGALIFSPPLRDNSQNVEKFHICINCWFDLKRFLEFSDKI